MKIIPVIDLKNGTVVSAIQGIRDSYQPIKSTLSTTSDIEDIIDGFLSIYPFKTIYIADLNAITNTGNNIQIINRVIKQYNAIEFWVDNGKQINDVSIMLDFKYRPIFGSENQGSANFKIINSLPKRSILSLDFFPNIGYSGPLDLLNTPDLWPGNIIIMNLECVGANSGPDFDSLSQYCQQHIDKNFIAAGGIRGERDLLKLKKIGVKHALIASALHLGKIDSETIKKLANNI